MTPSLPRLLLARSNSRTSTAHLARDALLPASAAPARRSYATAPAVEGVNSATSLATTDVSSRIPRTYTRDGKPKERLVVLGSGWAGYTLLRNIDKDKYDVFMVSPQTYFSMTPLLASVATGSLEFSNVLEPVRETSDTFFYHAWCDAIDFRNRKVHLMPAYPPPFHNPDPTLGGQSTADAKASTSTSPSTSPSPQSASAIPNARGGHRTASVRPPHRRAVEGSDQDESTETSRHHSHDAHETWKSQEEGRAYALPYDRLVIATGAYNRTFSTPGVAQNAWFLKDVQNARSIRWRILECFEQAEHPELSDTQRRNLLNFIIVGGGPTGSEFASSLFDLVNKDMKRVFPDLVKLCTITIYDAAGSILNTFDESLQQYARKQFQRDGIQLKLNRKPLRVERGRFIVEPDGEVPFGLLVWSTGNTQGPLVRSIKSIKKDKAGSLLTNDRLEVLHSSEDDATAGPEDLKGVYALGDCAQVEDYALPATAQVASQKADYLVQALNAGAAGAEGTAPSAASASSGPRKGFQWHDRGSMTNLTSGRGIAQLSRGKLQGRSASALWHSTYSLYMSISWRNKIAIPITWAMNRLFGRNLSRQ